MIIHTLKNMGSSRLVLSTLIPIFMHLFTTSTVAQEGCSSKAEFCWNCNSNVGNYTSSSIYSTNLRSLLSSISSDKQNNYGFYNSSFGDIPNTVNAIALCRGDIVQDECRSCLNETSYRLLEGCPNNKEAIIWDERCMVRYSNNSIFSIKKDFPLKTLTSPNAATNAEQFKLVLKPLLDDLRSKAASGSSIAKFAYGNATVPGAEGIFALLQCTPDLTLQDCNSCIEDAISQIPDCCAGKQGARVLKPSCNLRFESEPFYAESTVSSLPGSCSDGAEYCWSCTENGNSATTSVFKENLNSLLFSQLSSNTKNDYGFYNSSLGQNTNKVNAIAMCRGDIEMESCHKCMNESSNRLLERCPNRKEAIIWDERCMVRYSNKSIFSVLKEEPAMQVPSPNKTRDPNLFKLTLKPLLDNLSSRASSGDSRRKFATGQSTVPGYETIYALTQCTPDIEKKECSDCLQRASLSLPECCDDLQGARILKPSCSLRYEVSPFYNSTADDSTSPATPTPSRVIPNINKSMQAWKNWTEGTSLNVVDPTLELGEGEDSRSEIIKRIHIALLCVQENPTDRPTMNSVTVTLTSNSDTTLPGPSQPRLFEYSTGSNIGSDNFSLASEHNSKESKSNTSKSNSVQEASINEVSITGPCPR